MEKEEIGALVKRHRKLRGWTQEELAKRADLTLDVVNRVENARGVIGDGALQKIADVLDIVIPRPPIVPKDIIKT